MTYKPFTIPKKKLTMMTLSAAMILSMAAPAAFAEKSGGNVLQSTTQVDSLSILDNPYVFAFKDVSNKNTHYDAIHEAHSLGIMNGYPNGTFGAAESLSRSHTVKALGKYVLALDGLAISDVSLKDYAHVQPFNDVPKNHRDAELVLYSLVVKEAGIFKGSDNNLMPNKLISRQQMAQVLVTAFGLKDLEGVESNVKDMDLAFPYFRDHIKVLSENGVTAVEEFRPLDNTTRGQFASFLTRAYEINKIELVVPATVLAINAAENVDEMYIALKNFNNGKFKDVPGLGEIGTPLFRVYGEAEFRTKIQVTQAVNSIIEARNKLLTAINGAKTAKEMAAALDAFDMKFYEEADASYKEYLSEFFLKELIESKKNSNEPRFQTINDVVYLYIMHFDYGNDDT